MDNMNVNNRPLMVTIRCITYNHEPYIRQCLESFVMQKTNFRFEAIVHDDASTDGTAAIIREFAEKYPEIIKPIYETENQYSKHDGSLARILNEHTHGKYVALCEGDDYWIDPNKLQIQVDFLESHPEYTMCFHNAFVCFGQVFNSEKRFATLNNEAYSGSAIYASFIVPTASVMLKKCVCFSELYTSAKINKKFIYGDILLWLSCATFGKIYGMSKVMSVYRKHEGGAIWKMSPQKLIRSMEHNHEIPLVFGKEYASISRLHVYNSAIACICYCFRNRQWQMMVKTICKMFQLIPIYSCKRFMSFFVKYFLRMMR